MEGERLMRREERDKQRHNQLDIERWRDRGRQSLPKRDRETVRDKKKRVKERQAE